jgi:hypothetical protein
MQTPRKMSRRRFAALTVAGAAGFGAGAVGARVAPPSESLQSEFLLDLVLETMPASDVGSPGGNRVVVPVSGGTFDGPRLRGTVIGPGGDWIDARPDGSSVLDVRVLLQTHDNRKIYMHWRGIYYAPPGSAPYARILPMFETGAGEYLWLNHIVAVGVHRTQPGKVAYRVYQIL